MELLSKIGSTVTSPPAGTANDDRLMGAFQKISRDPKRLEMVNFYKEAIEYKMKNKARIRLCKILFGNQEMLTANAFLSRIKKKDNNIKTKDSSPSSDKKLEVLFKLYEDADGLIAFDDLNNMLLVLLQQLHCEINAVELTDLTRVIAGGMKEPFTSTDFKQMIDRWKGLGMKMSNILYSGLFLKPKEEIDPTLHKNRYPKFLRPRSIPTGQMFIGCILTYLALTSVVILSTVWYSDSQEYDLHKNWIIERNRWGIASNNITDNTNWHSSMKLNLKHVKKSSMHMIVKTTVTELLNLQLLLIYLLSLKFTRIMLIRAPMNRVVHREDIRLALWVFATMVQILCVFEIVLITYVSLVDRLPVHESIVFESNLANLTASFVKLILIVSALIFRLPPIRSRVVYACVDLTIVNMNLFLLVHLLQNISFLKWSVLMLIITAVDMSNDWNQPGIQQKTIKAKSCTPGGGMIITADRNDIDFKAGDIFFLTVEQVAVTSSVPAYPISSPTNGSVLEFHLKEGHWQTKVLRKYLRRIVEKITVNLHSDESAAVKSSSCMLNNVSLEVDGNFDSSAFRLSKRESTFKNQGSLFCYPLQIRYPIDLNIRVLGPCQRIPFDYIKSQHYKTIMLLVTPKSVGSVVAFLLEHQESSSDLKIHLYFACPKIPTVEWFLHVLVGLEISEAEKHSKYHSYARRSTCKQCRFFYGIFLTSADSDEDIRLTLIRLAMAILAGDKSHLIQYLQQSVYHNLEIKHICREFDIDYTLCDADFPRRQILTTLTKGPVEIVNF